MPTWGHRDYQLYPPHYGDPFYRGRREWLQERLMERSNGYFNRGNGRYNGVRPQFTTSTSEPQPDGQDDEWSVPPIAVRRDDMGRQQITQASPQPPLLLQSKDYSPIGVVKILQEKELIGDSNQLEV